MDSIMDKYEKLQDYLKSYKKLCVAYSGGADSTFLLKAAMDALGTENVIAVIAETVFLSKDETHSAKKVAESIGARCFTVNIDLLYIPQIANNEMNRCYHCKKTIFMDIAKTAFNYGIKTIADGTIVNDTMTYRPGAAALAELGVISPLRDNGLYKKDIRQISEQLGLPTWNKPTNSCLATRFPSDTEITEEKLEKVEKAEEYLKSLGVAGVLRFRTHGDIARIEVEPSEMGKIAENPEIAEFVKGLGFRYATLDLNGYRTGSMDTD